MDAAYVVKSVDSGDNADSNSAEVIDRGSIPFSLTLKDESECRVSSGDNSPEGENGESEEEPSNTPN